MNLVELLTPDRVCLNLPGNNKQEIIQSLLDLACATGKVSDKDAALHSVLQRESRMSTGMEFGVAIPHGKTDAVAELLAFLALKPEGVDFDALDGSRSRIFLFTLSPLARKGPHVQFLTDVSRLLTRAELREQLLTAETPQQAVDILLSGLPR
ncbi:PTS sugar transporter subunit IIA [Spirochaeta africana]|uniref:Phosphotransferase system mannitol/fructose-specifc IIA component (Ntr-type) n=1 Tax=Spirochaeta africana (strain ATCC 700263 / DSM 8902 / Z-7692) TaxID=889378 RepID=H9UFY0_SPIAZ|nr:PTS sugar transporter subunit IIA [Spirochaeta africana]AFG36423.1 phosphotransferase system mannitol/fructose-specifc IIA component (Ntr-type) [Spirochaeta africana DSM 8902]